MRFFFLSTKEISIPSKVSIICENAFNTCSSLKKVEIPKNSNLQTIESYAFSDTDIKEIYFPASLKELEECWCFGIRMLTKITISPSNGHLKMKENKYLIGNSDSNKYEFGILLFAYRDIKEVSIPSSIKVISPYAFYNCRNLTTVEIPTNSNLQTIEQSAFYFSNIESVYIPSKFSKICEYAFQNCQKLTKVEIPANSNLQPIKSYAFSFTSIKGIFIPSNVSEILFSG